MKLVHVAGLSLLVAISPGLLVQSAESALGPPLQTLALENGNLSILLRDNSYSPGVLSGVDCLFNRSDAPDFDAFDPDDRGASAGLNFEHIISGHSNRFNAFSPRRGKYELHRVGDGRSGVLVRNADDDPWALSSTLKHTLVEPNSIDFEFECGARRPELFGDRGYAVLFFADYMNDVSEIPIHFRGVDAPGEAEHWMAAEAPPGHPNYNQGGTYMSVPARALEYDTNHNFKLNLWTYDYPRFTQPFYYGRADHGMGFILMFDRMHSVEDEIRFSIFKFKVPRRPRPAWDFQYVIHHVEAEHTYGFKG